MFDGIAEHDGRKTELANAIFYATAYFYYCFFLIYFY